MDVVKDQISPKLVVEPGYEIQDSVHTVSNSVLL